MERTLIIIKPDAVERKLIGRIITRFEEKNYNVILLKSQILPREAVEKHYEHIKMLEIYEDVVKYMTSSVCILIVLEGDNVVSTVRNLIGKTSSFESSAGTIRGDYGSHKFMNIIHASDSVENAKLEIERFFPEISDGM